jgi:hypothetical protein
MNSEKTAPESTESEPQSPTTGTDCPDDESSPDAPREIGGRKGPDPTRFGDWEKGGRCIDF